MGKYALLKFLESSPWSDEDDPNIRTVYRDRDKSAGRADGDSIGVDHSIDPGVSPTIATSGTDTGTRGGDASATPTGVGTASTAIDRLRPVLVRTTGCSNRGAPMFKTGFPGDVRRLSLPNSRLCSPNSSAN